MTNKKSSGKRANNRSADRFVALPVSGDGFILSRDNKHSLIDGGKNGEELYKQLQDELGEKPNLRRIVCTHNDADHAAGLADMLKQAKNLTIDEVWLPAVWQDPLKLLIENPTKFYDDVAREIGVAVEETFSEINEDPLDEEKNLAKGRHSDEESIDKRSFKSELGKANNKINKDKLKISLHQQNITKKTQKILSISDYEDILEESPGNIISLSFSALSHPFLHQSRLEKINLLNVSSTVKSAATLAFLEFLEAGKRILEIAAGSKKYGAKLRWFDADQYYRDRTSVLFSTGGDKNEFLPLNAIEVTDKVTETESPLEMLYLTEVNKHSLNFYVPEDKKHPGVIFSADGLLDCDLPTPLPTRNVIVTAPHHGSESNAPEAYDRLETWFGPSWRDKVLLVRSDVKSSSRPCSEFQSTMQRICTVCIKNDFKYSKVKLPVANGAWDLAAARSQQSNRICDCK